MTMSCSFTVPGRPRGKGRPRFAAGRVYTPPETKAYESEIRMRAHLAKPKGWPLDASYHVVIHADMVNRAHQPDADNIVKAVLDGMNGTLYKDDRSVHRLYFDFDFDADEPRVVVSVHVIGESTPAR